MTGIVDFQFAFGTPLILQVFQSSINSCQKYVKNNKDLLIGYSSGISSDTGARELHRTEGQCKYQK